MHFYGDWGYRSPYARPRDVLRRAKIYSIPAGPNPLDGICALSVNENQGPRRYIVDSRTLSDAVGETVGWAMCRLHKPVGTVVGPFKINPGHFA